MADEQSAETQAEVDAVEAALRSAWGALEEKTVLDYSDLKKATTEVPADGSMYTEATWANVQTALTAANALLENKNAKDQDEIAKAAKDLRDAIAALEKKPAPPTLNYNNLIAAINKAEAIIGNTYSIHYTMASIQDSDLEKVLTDVKAEYKAGNLATQGAIDAATKKLTDAFAKLVVLSAPTLGDVTAGTHTQLRGETIITNERMTLNTKRDGISIKEYMALLNFNIEGEDVTSIITIDGVNIADIDDNALIYTGATVTVVAANSAGKDTKTYTVVVMGDNSGDGTINILDVVRACKHLGDVESLEGFQSEAMEINAHKGIDIGDLVHLAHVIGEQ
jgi:hypothetical protein